MRLDEFPQLNDLTFRIDEEDNFSVTIEQAFMIQKRISLFNVIRRCILPKEGRLFDLHIDYLITLLEDEDHRALFKLPEDWSAGINDRGLINAINENGIKYLKDVKYSTEYGLHACRVNQKRLLRRVEFLCHYFKNITMKKSGSGNAAAHA